MAKYGGRTFTSACEECGNTFSATHQYKADAQATACYETHYPVRVERDLKEVLDEIKDHIGEW